MGGAGSGRTLVACACAILGAHCFALTSVDGLSGGTPDDAASVADADGAETTGQTNDASVPSPFCASQAPAPTFCDDFDTAALAERWDERREEGGGAANVDSVAAKSTPNSFVAMTDASTPDSDAIRGRVCRTVSRVAQSLRVEFVQLMEQVSATERIDFASIRLGNPDNTFYVTLALDRAGTWQLVRSAIGSVNVPATAIDFNGPVELHAWTRFRIDLKLEDANAATPSGSVTVDVEGRRVLDTTIAIPFKPVSSQLCIGITYAKLGTQHTRVRFDDVILDLRD